MPIDPSRAKDHFFAALEMPAHQRAAYLDSACGDDKALRQRIDAMLASQEASGELLPRSPAAMLGETELPSEPLLAPVDGESEGMTFLTPSTKVGSVGRLGHYEILEVIGKGGFGTVLRAFDEKLHRVVAIKVLAPELAASATARHRFIREARAAAAVTHDHVVTIHVVDEEHRPPYLVMQLIDGVTLQQKLDKVGVLNLKEILRVGMQMAEGLAAAHKQGLVHRDIKPANVLLENGIERVKITDFGLAKIADDASVTQSGVVAGTPMYMSPEQANGDTIDHRSDLFSLGTVLYVMCTGRPPFRASGTMAVLKRVINDTPRPVREINPEIPHWLEAIIVKLHAKKPERRFQTAKEVAELLGQHLAHLQQPQISPKPAALVPTWSGWDPMDGTATPPYLLPGHPGRRLARFLGTVLLAPSLLLFAITIGFDSVPYLTATTSLRPQLVEALILGAVTMPVLGLMWWYFMTLRAEATSEAAPSPAAHASGSSRLRHWILAGALLLAFAIVAALSAARILRHDDRARPPLERPTQREWRPAGHGNVGQED